MIVTEQIRAAVTAYLGRHPDESRRLTPLTDALAGAADLTSRKTLDGHVTCSALVIDPAGRVLYIRHNVLKMWLPPGGHLEPDDATLAGAALREVTEEAGIPAEMLTLVDALPIDIDVHPIPANPAKSEPDHQHFDLCYAFTAVATPQVVLQADEVHDFAWVPAAEITPAALATRVATVFSAA